MNLYILNYNNYYNRLLKREESLTDYLPYVTHTLPDANFNENDGINTSHVFGSAVHSYNGEGDYLLAVSDDNQITSRWFIIEKARTRKGQWSVELYRDVIADFYDDVMNATCYIEKGYVNNDNDPAIFNHEDFSVNQIKTREIPLKDASNSKWIVGYIAKDFAADNISIINQNALPYDHLIGDDSAPIYDYLEGGSGELLINPKNARIRFIASTISITSTSSREDHVEWYASLSNGDVLSINTYLNDGARQYRIITTPAGVSTESIENRVRTKFKTIYNNNAGALESATYALYNDVDYSNNKDIKDLYSGKLFYNTTQSKIYKITAIRKGTKTVTKDIINGARGWNDYVDVARAFADDARWNINNDCEYASTSIDFERWQFRIEDKTSKYSTLDLTANIPSSRARCADAAFDIFALPYQEEGDGYQVYYENSVDGYFNMSADLTMLIAQNLAYKYGVGQTSNLYDIQLLPYCPLDLSSYRTNALHLNQSNTYSIITDANGTKVGCIYFATSSRRQFTIEGGVYGIPLNNSYERKLANELFCVRLTSGDYSSSFEFSPAKLDAIDYYNVDIALKPYQPYIHVAPNFSRLYGQDFNDPRGLVCGGDFSLSTITDPFNTYKLQNKNFQLAFDRQIENMEVQQKAQRIGDIAGAISGTFSGAASGAMAGANAGPYGAIAGAVAGGALSLGAGIADVRISDKLRTEALDYTKDQFNYQLGNIKALPNTLNKVDSFNQNNKVYPLLEIYTCTDIERQAFEDKLLYNGWTIMRIGRPQDFASSPTAYRVYLKVKLIRLEGITDDFHLVNVISQELNKGIYV